MRKVICLSLLLLVLSSCSRYYPGRDKEIPNAAVGALIGAGSGAVTGFQLGAPTGAGAAAGAGFGAVAGLIHGMVLDSNEERARQLALATRVEKERALAHEMLADHYARRLELHPTRDIFPADMFFFGDASSLTVTGAAVVRELAVLNKTRYPWSRLGVVVYVQSKSIDNGYARLLAAERSREIGDLLVRSGIEPRRIETRAMATTAPVLIDPYDHPARYAQAIEIVPLDIILR